MINLSKAMSIPGWMDPKELFWLAHEAQKHNYICEIGCWMGRSTRALADHSPGSVWAVDTWKGSEEHQEQLIDKHPDWLFGQFLANMEGLNNVFPVRKPSVEAAEIFRVSGVTNFDMVFIDASHDYDNVKADILAWKSHVKPGGIICGHDAGYGPVEKATHEIFPDVIHEGVIWVKQL